MMEIKETRIKVSDIIKNYIDNNEEGVKGYNGLLNIRPAYQREFCYNDKERNKVIETVTLRRPLGSLYWVKNQDGTFELLDGQQRTLSLCQFCNSEFSINGRAFHNLLPEEQEKIMNYTLLIYICEDGTKAEQLDWFRTINIAGKKLTDQELLNTNYLGPWLEDAKRKFSKTNCVAYLLGNKYVNGTPIRQEYLEIVLKWISNGHIEDYMSAHQFDPTATELWNYFQNVISWVKDMFPNYRKEMKNVQWGLLYNKYHQNHYDPKELETQVKELMSSDEIAKKEYIYEYILSNKQPECEKLLHLRVFSEADKRAKYEEQNGICPHCGKHFAIEDMEGDHIIPFRDNGKTRYDNLQMLCKACNLKKGAMNIKPIE